MMEQMCVLHAAQQGFYGPSSHPQYSFVTDLGFSPNTTAAQRLRRAQCQSRLHTPTPILAKCADTLLHKKELVHTCLL